MSEQAANVLDGLVNIRDLEGLPAEGGRTTRPGVLYRSDAPHVGDRAPEAVGTWPPAAVIDLRDRSENTEEEHPLAGETVVHRIPLLEDLRNESGAEPWLTLAELYGYVLDHAPQRMLQVFRVAVEADGPVLVHCAAGKDRTGVVCALLGRAAGVDADAVIEDYVRTGRNMHLVLQRLRVTPAPPPGVDEKAVDELVAAPAEAIEGVVARLDAHQGGAAGWLLAQGARAEELTRWRDRFLESVE